MIIGTLVPETFDVFQVIQMANYMPLGNKLAIDHVYTPPGKMSEIHRHDKADTYLFIIDGKGTVIIGDSEVKASHGMLLHIQPGVFHGVRTENEGLTFVSVQSPPIFDSDGNLDLVPMRTG